MTPSILGYFLVGNSSIDGGSSQNALQLCNPQSSTSRDTPNGKDEDVMEDDDDQDRT